MVVKMAYVPLNLHDRIISDTIKIIVLSIGIISLIITFLIYLLGE